MKVYIVISPGYYNDGYTDEEKKWNDVSIKSVFTNRLKAEIFVEENKDERGYTGWFVAEFDVTE